MTVLTVGCGYATNNDGRVQNVVKATSVGAIQPAAPPLYAAATTRAIVVASLPGPTQGYNPDANPELYGILMLTTMTMWTAAGIIIGCAVVAMRIASTAPSNISASSTQPPHYDRPYHTDPAYDCEKRDYARASGISGPGKLKGRMCAYDVQPCAYTQAMLRNIWSI